jgi:hypothetical protein
MKTCVLQYVGVTSYIYKPSPSLILALHYLIAICSGCRTISVW